MWFNDCCSMKKTALIILFCMAFVMLFSMLSRTSQVNAATDYVIDTFTRSVSNGWGTAETGGIYAFLHIKDRTYPSVSTNLHNSC